MDITGLSCIFNLLKNSLVICITIKLKKYELLKTKI